MLILLNFGYKNEKPRCVCKDFHNSQSEVLFPYEISANDIAED
jgi:hypothetical protein